MSLRDSVIFIDVPLNFLVGVYSQAPKLCLDPIDPNYIDPILALLGQNGTCFYDCVIE